MNASFASSQGRIEESEQRTLALEIAASALLIGGSLLQLVVRRQKRLITAHPGLSELNAGLFGQAPSEETIQQAVSFTAVETAKQNDFDDDEPTGRGEDPWN